MRFVLSMVALALSFSVVAGCGESNPRKAVSGKVTLKGVNLDEGTIDFLPIAGTSAEGLPSSTSGAVISQGVYEITADAGLVPGKYKVLISSGDGRTPDNEDELIQSLHQSRGARSYSIFPRTKSAGGKFPNSYADMSQRHTQCAYRRGNSHYEPQLCA